MRIDIQCTRGTIGKSEPLKKCLASTPGIRNCISLQRATPDGSRNANCEQSFAAIDASYNIQRGTTGKSEPLKKCMASNSSIRNRISLQRAMPDGHAQCKLPATPDGHAQCKLRAKLCSDRCQLQYPARDNRQERAFKEMHGK